MSDGRVPTRPCNWHDFFNVMMFVAFPISKSLIHARHRQILEQHLPDLVAQLPGRRTAEQDCLTMLDEGGVLLVAEQDAAESIEALLDFGKHQALMEPLRAGRLRPWLLGHAHAEHLAKCHDLAGVAALPRAKPLVLGIGANAARTQIDAALAERLRDPACCAGRDGRRAVGLGDLYLDLVEGHDHPKQTAASARRPPFSSRRD